MRIKNCFYALLLLFFVVTAMNAQEYSFTYTKDSVHVHKQIKTLAIQLLEEEKDTSDYYGMIRITTNTNK